MSTSRITDRLTDNQQTINRQSTDNQQQYKNEKKERRKEEKEKTPSVFSPPTVEEVEDYCRSRGNGISGQEFVDFYESKGWMIGKNRMKNWRAAVRTWENERKKSGGSPSPAPTKKPNATDVHGYAQRDYSSEQAAAMHRMMNDTWGDE